MILEVATIDVKSGAQAAFETAFAQARALPEAIEGFQGLELRRCIETPDRYVLLAWWDTLDAHTRDFRESEHFVRWRELLGPFFAAPPAVFHAGAPL